jgi:hypothetical protein
MKHMTPLAIRSREAVLKYKASLLPIRTDGANDMVDRFVANAAIAALQARLEEVERLYEDMVRKHAPRRWSRMQGYEGAAHHETDG